MNSYVPRCSSNNPGFFEVSFRGQPVQVCADFGTEFNYLLKSAADELGIHYDNLGITKAPRILTDFRGKKYCVVGTTEEIRFNLQRDTVSIFANVIAEQSEDGEDSTVVTYYMHQRYAGILQVKSLLRVTVVDIGNSTEQARTSDVHRQTKGKPTARIVKIVEEWNGVQPMQYPPFQLSRRINGLLSWWATSLLVR